MKTGPFKMKGFGGFGNSPVKNDKKYQKCRFTNSFLGAYIYIRGSPELYTRH